MRKSQDDCSSVMLNLFQHLARFCTAPVARDPDIRQDDCSSVMLNLFQHLAQPAQPLSHEILTSVRMTVQVSC